VVPNAGTGDRLVVGEIGGMKTPAGVFITLQ